MNERLGTSSGGWDVKAAESERGRRIQQSRDGGVILPRSQIRKAKRDHDRPLHEIKDHYFSSEKGDEVNRLFAATNKLSYKVFFFTVYSMGLRLGEGIRLTVGDIDSANMRVHIRNAKGNKDRLVPLPDKTLHTMKDFWRVHRHPHFMFPSRKRGLKNVMLVNVPLDRGGIQSAMKAVVVELGIKKNFLPFPASQLCHASP